MKKRLVFLLALLATGSGSLAQSTAETASKKVILKFAPLPLYDLYNTVQLGIEIPFKNEQFSFHQELGYGHSSFNLWFLGEDDIPNIHNFRSRSQVRFYYRTWQRVRAYVAGEHFARNSIAIGETWVGKGCETGRCNYAELTGYRSRRLVNAMHVKVGWQFYFSGRLTLDMYAGMGLRQLRIKSLTPGFTDESSWGGEWGDWDWWERDRPGVYNPIPSLACGVQLGIRLGKQERQKP